MSQFDEAHTEALERELAELRGALLDDTIRLLGPEEPTCVSGAVTVKDAVARMMAARQAAVLVVDAQGLLEGIFTERDVLTRVVAGGQDPARTPVGQVMTPNPEALGTGDRVAHAVNRMSVAGYRTIPIVDGERRPVGVVTVSHVIKWMAELFPEAVLNLRPGDALKRPSEVDSG